MPRYTAFAVVILSAVLFFSSAYAENTVKTIKLAGSPEEIGKVWGIINKDAILNDFNNYFLKPSRENNISRETLIQRSEKFVEIAHHIAPHWLEEAKAIADASGVDKKLYISFIASVYRNLFLHECTSYAVSKKIIKNSAVFFHKNRDNVEKKQSVFIIDTDRPNINKFIAVSDASVLSCMMMVNNKGLAGSADTGGVARTPGYRGMMNTFMLRHIAETASNCEEALKIIQKFVAHNWYAGGNRSATHWLFVDNDGVILEVENTVDNVSFAYHNNKIYFSIRGNTKAAQILKNTTHPIDFHIFHNISREPSICFDTSISGMTVEINPDYPEYLTCVWISFPAKSLSFPLYMGGEHTPIPLMNGELYTVARDLNRCNYLWESLEKNIYFNKQILEDRLVGVLEKNKKKEAIHLIDSWIRQNAGAQLDLLKVLAGKVNKDNKTKRSI